jgi:hypothetical protein
MNLPGKKRDYLDLEVYQLVSLIETSEFTTMQRVEYVSEKDDSVIDLSDKFMGALITKEKVNSEVVSIKSSEGNICRELKPETYNRYIKFVNTILKSTEINPYVSKKFLMNLVFDYIIEAHKLNKSEGNFSDFLVDKIEKEIKEYKIYFSIHNLEVFLPLTIGKVQLGLLERNIVVADNIKKDANSVEFFKKKYGKQLFASYTVKAEKEKAIELAFSECSLAIDILKICSDTMDDPNCKISFDIDSRVSEALTAEIIVKNTFVENDINIIQHRIPNFHQINNEYIKRLTLRNFNFFHNFLLTLGVEKTELQQLCVNAIRRFGKALTSNNLNQRVVELFTIMESLVVPNPQSNIQESLTLYCSKLIHSEKEDRIKLIKLIKKMYDVRSAYIHHAVEKDFDVNDLQELQQSVQALIGNLIQKSRQYQNKSSILKEIDDAILGAY